jgi:hypothetical protein
MAVTIPTSEPTEITAGDSAAWTKSLADFSASDGWVLSYTLINAASKISISTSASGADHATSVAASVTAGWAPGTYYWQAVCTLGLARYTVGTGSITVRPNLAVATLFDTRTPAAIALAAADLALATYGAKAYLQEYEINGRRQKFTDPSAFMAWRNALKQEVARETNVSNIAAGMGDRSKVFVRLGRA